MSDDDELRRKVQEAMGRVPAPAPPDLAAVDRRVRRHRRRRIGFGSLATAIIMAMVAVPLALLSGLGGGSRTPAASPASRISALTDVAEVVCDETGTHVLTPVVRPQPDGVHFQVENMIGALHLFVIYQSGDGWGVLAAPGTSEPGGPETGAGGWSVPPGNVTVDCGGIPPLPPSPGEATFEVVDEDGIWVPTTLGCQDYKQSFSGYPAEVGPDPVQLARDHFGGLQESDVVRLAGYPEAAAPTVVVERDGAVIALVDIFRHEDGEWLLERAKVCSDSGLTG
jgi:hypothetical protein